jgi:PII-like signaling protein
MLLQGVYLRFFMHANARHEGKLLYEWLLEQARREGIAGGSVFRAVAGYGRHGVLHEEAFFELAGNLPLKVEFILGEDNATRLVDIVRSSGAELVYARSPVEYGVLERDEGQQ